MTKVSARIIDKGFSRIVREVPRLREFAVEVGVQADAGPGTGGTPIAEYAFYNEFGTRRIPSRPFMRNAYDNNVRELNATKVRLVRLIIDGKIGIEQANELLGQLHEGHVKRTITQGVPPPNAPLTVALKGSSKTLIDQGNLLGAIRYVVRKVRRGQSKTAVATTGKVV